MSKKIIEIKSKYSVKKADGKSVCEGCALRIGILDALNGQRVQMIGLA